MPILNQGAPVAMSFGCTGSRIYTDMGIDKMVVGIKGDRLAEFSQKLERIVRANKFVNAEDSVRKEKSPNSFHAR